MSTRFTEEDCRVFQDAASDYLGGYLTQDEVSAYSAHLSQCEECLDCLRSLTQLIRELGALRLQSVEPDAEARFLSALSGLKEGSEGAEEGLHDLRCLWRELQVIPSMQRSDFLADRERFRSRRLCQWLAARARSECQSNTGLALDLVEVAILIGRRLPRNGENSNLLAECWSTMAVCCLALMDLAGAKRNLEVAERHFEMAEKTPLTKARLLMVRASLLSTLGRTDQAIRRYVECQNIFESLGEREPALSMRINIGSAYLRSGQPDDAKRIFEEVQPLIGERDTPAMAFGALINLAIAHCELGESSEAERLLPRLVELDRQLPSSRQIHLTWLSGSIARAQKDLQRALDVFGEVRQVFQETGEWIHYIESSLDMARVHLLQGDWIVLPKLLQETRLCAKAMRADKNCLEALRLLKDRVSGQLVEESSLRALALLLANRSAWRDASF